MQIAFTHLWMFIDCAHIQLNSLTWKAFRFEATALPVSNNWCKNMQNHLTTTMTATKFVLHTNLFLLDLIETPLSDWYWMPKMLLFISQQVQNELQFMQITNWTFKTAILREKIVIWTRQAQTCRYYIHTYIHGITLGTH